MMLNEECIELKDVLKQLLLNANEREQNGYCSYLKIINSYIITNKSLEFRLSSLIEQCLRKDELLCKSFELLLDLSNIKIDENGRVIIKLENVNLYIGFSLVDSKIYSFDAIDEKYVDKELSSKFCDILNKMKNDIKRNIFDIIENAKELKKFSYEIQSLSRININKHFLFLKLSDNGFSLNVGISTKEDNDITINDEVRVLITVENNILSFGNAINFFKEDKKELKKVLKNIINKLLQISFIKMKDVPNLLKENLTNEGFHIESIVYNNSIKHEYYFKNRKGKYEEYSSVKQINYLNEKYLKVIFNDDSSLVIPKDKLIINTFDESLGKPSSSYVIKSLINDSSY